MSERFDENSNDDGIWTVNSEERCTTYELVLERVQGGGGGGLLGRSESSGGGDKGKSNNRLHG